MAEQVEGLLDRGGSAKALDGSLIQARATLLVENTAERLPPVTLSLSVVLAEIGGQFEHPFVLVEQQAVHEHGSFNDSERHRTDDAKHADSESQNNFETWRDPRRGLDERNEKGAFSG